MGVGEAEGEVFVAVGEVKEAGGAMLCLYYVFVDCPAVVYYVVHAQLNNLACAKSAKGSENENNYIAEAFFCIYIHTAKRLRISACVNFWTNPFLTLGRGIRAVISSGTILS